MFRVVILVAEHPIEGLMSTAMESIREMVDVNTIVGDAVQAPDGTVIIPISRVSFGFAAGGGEYSAGLMQKNSKDEDEDEKESTKFPFAGGSGAGVSINPVAFLVVGNGAIRLLPVNMSSSLDRLVDMVPDVLSKISDTMKKKITVKKEIKNNGEVTYEKTTSKHVEVEKE